MRDQFDLVPAHEWPPGDKLLPLLLQRQKDSELIELLNPILHETSLKRPERGFENPQGYMNYAPKVLMRAFVTKDRRTSIGGAVFTVDAAGLSGDADAGAIASMLDNVLGVFSFAVKQQTTVTRSFRVVLSKAVPLQVAVEYHCAVTGEVGRRLVLSAVMLDPFDGTTLCTAEAEFAVLAPGTPFYLPFSFENCGGFGEIVAAAMAKPRQVRRVPNRNREWPPLGKSLARWLSLAGFRGDLAWHVGPNDSAKRVFEFGMAPKMRMKAFHSRDGKTMCAVVEFSPLTAGPPGRANGGSVLCGMATAAAHFLGDSCGEDYVVGEFSTLFRRGTPLGAIACLTCTRGELHSDASSVEVKMELTVMNDTNGMEFRREDTRAWDPANTSVVASSSALLSRRRAGAPRGSRL